MILFDADRPESHMMSLLDQTSDDGPVSTALPKRDTWAAVKRGLAGKCPACGRGRILYAYLKVHPTCPSCGEELHHHRADDFPPYITMFVVGHIVGAAMFAAEDFWPDIPMGVHIATWPTLCVVLSLWLLPIFKSGLIAYQWALRMHGFETAHQHPALAAGASDVRQRAAA